MKHDLVLGYVKHSLSSSKVPSSLHGAFSSTQCRSTHKVWTPDLEYCSLWNIVARTKPWLIRIITSLCARSIT